MNFKHYISELKRRNVFKSALAYLVVAWLIIQVLSIILPTFGTPPFILKFSIILLSVLFPVWIAFSWVYDLTEKGIEKTKEIEEDEVILKSTEKKLTTIIIGTLSLIIVILLAQNFSKNSKNSEIISSKKIEKNTRNSIAILPFTNLSLEKENAFFTDGMHEDVLNKLARLKDLKVIARTSLMKYRNFKGNLDSLGTILKADFFVEGSVRKFENQIRVTVSLIKADTNETLWSNNYDKELKNVFTIQNEIAQEIVDNLKTNISLKETEELTKIPTNNIKAYENYLMARNILNGFTNPSELQKAIIFLNNAVQLDPYFIDAWELLTISNCDLYDQSFDFDNKTINENSKIAAEKALNKTAELAPNSVHYLRALGYFQNNVLKEPIAALKNFDKVIEIMPNDVKTLLYQGMMYLYLGQVHDGIQNMEKALAIDNQNGLIKYILSSTYSYTGKYKELIELYKNILKQDPEKTHLLIEIKYNQFLIDGSIASFKELENEISNVRLTDRCDLQTVKDNKMVVAMFNNDYESFSKNWIGKWDQHHAEHGNWSCPAIINDELNQANLMLKNNKITEANQIIQRALETIEKPINEKSQCVFNGRVYKPKLDFLLGDKMLARQKFEAIVDDVMRLDKFPRGLVERKILLQTADLVAPDKVYSIYKQITSKELSLIRLETICANPWTYPNLLKNPDFQKEIRKDGRFVAFLEMNTLL